MFKKLTQLRRDKHQAVHSAPNPPPTVPAVAYDNEFSSPAAVEYNMSPPTMLAQTDASFPAVDYDQSAPTTAAQTPNETIAQVMARPPVTFPAVDYDRSAPVEQSIAPPPPVTFPAVEYTRSAPAEQVETNRQQEPRYEMNATRSPAELPGMNTSQIKAYLHHELPGDLPPARYEMPAVNSPRPTLTPSATSSSGSTRRSWSNASTPVTTPPTSPHPGTNLKGGTLRSGPNNTGITKYTVNVFCQRKTEPGASRREELPRDIREFRLTKLALIPVVAGEKKFLSIDLVFGERDQGVAKVLEKHFVLTRDTKADLMGPAFLPGYSEGNVKVIRISPLKVAYVGMDTVLYVDFKSEEDCKWLALEVFEIDRADTISSYSVREGFRCS